MDKMDTFFRLLGLILLGLAGEKDVEVSSTEALRYVKALGVGS